jgi:lysophospholipase L1-like esterase
MLLKRLSLCGVLMSSVLACSSGGDATPRADGGKTGAGGATTGKGGASTGTGGASAGATANSGGAGIAQGGTSVASGGVSTTAAGGSSAGATAVGGGVAQGGNTTNGGAQALGGSSNGGAAGSSGAAGKAGSGGSNSGGSAQGGGVGAGGASKGGSTGSGGAATGGSASGGATGTGGASTTAGVRIVGRTAAGTTSGSSRFSWSGVNINASFTGSQVSMDLKDGSNANRFTVVVDGGTPKTITTASGQTSIALATGLTNGTHSVVVWRNTEAKIGVSEFSSLSNFGTGGSLLAAPAAPDRRIEVIGDSLSAGAGVEGTSTTCSPSIDAFTNNYLAYGSVAARAVKADIVTIAYSGAGVYQGYSSTDPLIPAIYDYSIPNDKSAWDFSKYQPHVVVINLGTNDFSQSRNPGQAFVDAYVTFVKHIRSKYATANFILIDMYGGTQGTAINTVSTTLKSGGESKVEVLSLVVSNNNTACNSHPNTAAQQAMGTILANRLKALMSWQ